jgi:hypothetical protein
MANPKPSGHPISAIQAAWDYGRTTPVADLHGTLVKCLLKPVRKLKISKLDENDIFVFDLKIELVCNENTSNGLE